MSPWYAGITPIVMGMYLIFFQSRKAKLRNVEDDRVQPSAGKKKLFLFLGIALILIGIGRMVMPFLVAS